jgi:rfaE bifunctional protein kinase chain/domain/rfaE bifunctional protein nucleotidyltransferase chain/domain
LTKATSNQDAKKNFAARPARSKVKSISELASLVSDSQKAGEKVVLAHGVFDLVHMGHVRHLEAARREGTVLVVTITADKHVHKGPGRPIFPEELRAEMLAAMEYVDWVGINLSPDATELLRQLRPDVYIKGSDYENPEDDLTGMISAERDAVEEHGGKMVLTRDITFSSSSLINNYLDVYEPSLRDYLGTVRDAGGFDAIQVLIEKVKNYRVLLVGDLIIDEYQYVTPLGKSPKENMIATLLKDREIFAGGVIAAANHVASFCAEVEVITCLGDQDDYEQLVRDSLKPNVKLTVFRRNEAPTTTKTRFIESGYIRKLFEVYSMDDSPLEATLEADVNKAIVEKAKNSDVVIATDFGHGLIGNSTVQTLIEHAKFLAVNTQSNSANTGFNLVTKYQKADYVCIDAPEARLATVDKHSDVMEIAAEKLPEKIDCSRLIVTHGSHGCVTYDKAHGARRIPVFTKTTVDTVGAGDAFLAVTSPLVAAGGDMEHIGLVGNAVGAIKVGIIGHRHSVEKTPLMKYITTLLK